MRPVYWKVSTFASMGLAVAFAVHPLGAKAGPGAIASAQAADHTSSRDQGAPGPAAWLGGFFASPPASPTVAKTDPLAKLNAARSMSAQCEALADMAGDEELVQNIIDYAGKSGRVKSCAIEALGKSKSAAARSWLADLLHDPDTQVRVAAVDALGARENDSEAQAILMDAAHDGDYAVRTRALISLGNQHVAGAAPMLLDAISGTDRELQPDLVAALGETHDPKSVPVLAELVRSGSTESRTAAIRALGSVGGAEATQTLSDILRTGGSADTTAAIQALGESNDPVGDRVLMDATSDPRPEVAEAALRSLADRDGDEVRDVMSRALDSHDPKLAGSAATYFASHKEAGAVNKLLDLAKRGNEASAEAVSAIATIGGDEARSALVDVASRPGNAQGVALRQLASDPVGKVEARKVALQMVSQGGQCASNAIESLSVDASDEARDALVRVTHQGGNLAGVAVNALARRGDPESMRALRDAAASKDQSLRSEALSALGSSGRSEAAPILASAAHDKDPSVRASALSALARLGGPEAEKAIAESATSNDTSSRMLAVQALSQRSVPGGAATLENLAKDHDTNVARNALRALADAAPDRALPLVEDAMRSSNRAARMSALSAASSLESAPQARIFSAAAHDTDPSIARIATMQLARLGGPSAQSTLVDLLTDSDAPDSSKKFAADALTEMGGEAASRYHDLIQRYSPEPTPDEGEEE
jgi:HEAT repeat protein